MSHLTVSMLPRRSLETGYSLPWPLSSDEAHCAGRVSSPRLLPGLAFNYLYPVWPVPCGRTGSTATQWSVDYKWAYRTLEAPPTPVPSLPPPLAATGLAGSIELRSQPR